MSKLIIILFFVPFSLFGQSVKDSLIRTPIFSLSYAVQIPEGDLVKRFGPNSSLGILGGFKTTKNIQFEIGGTFFFSQNVKETTMLDGLKTSDGNIINNIGEYNNFLVYERGFTGSVRLGKIFPIIGPNLNSGILVKLGIGVMRHKVRIDNQGNHIPQLSKDKLPYYDRLTIGSTIYQYLGYQHLSNNRLTNFNIGIEIYEGFTQGMRDYQVDLMGPYKEKRLDILSGIRLGWIIPFYKKTPQDFYFN